MRETNTSQESVQSGRQACCAYGGAWRCEGGCAPSRIVAESRLGPSLSAGLAEASCQRRRVGRRAGRACAPLHAGLTLVASAGVCAGPRGRQPPREGSLAKRDGGAEGWASRAGGEENGVSGQRAEEDEAASRQQTHFITPIWAEPRGTRAHPTSNQPRLTVSLQVSLTGQLSHYIKLLVSGAAQGDVPIRCEPYQLHGRPTSGREGPRGDHISRPRQDSGLRRGGVADPACDSEAGNHLGGARIGTRPAFRGGPPTA